MPEEAVAPAPMPAEAAPAPAAAPAAPKQDAGGMRVLPSRARAEADLDKRFGIKSDPDVPAASTAPSKDEPKKDAAAPAAPTEDDAPPKDVDPKKAKPWTMYRTEKAQRQKLEAENQQLRAAISPEKVKEYETQAQRLTELQKKQEDYETYLRYTNYQQSEEFKSKYQAPYEAAWKRAMSEVSQLSVDDGNGGQRVATPDDLLQLVNLPLGQARAVAEQLFGSFANDVMGYRKEIRGLFDQQSSALDDAKKNGAARIKQAQEHMANLHKAMSEQITKTWQEVNAKVAADEKFGRYFSNREGDEAWNERLKKGYELADQAFSEDPRNPNLKPEERAAIIKRHAAVRNRAASWGALRHENEVLASKLAKLEAELGSYKKSEPAAGTRTPPSDTRITNAKASDRAGADLERLFAGR